ncbi:ATP-dependent nuclease [Leptolyngbya sp. KIOST-1]|uniref:ATP-dependent nuclease n=1 Tax=Leptolyngbya sp. KIOST-1 TaxID=1229172 RepID=UPI000907A4E1|nr:AAA family ATPase [Leptolyngbya sp. KIOST-1]
MRLKNIRIKSYRTISSEQSLDLSKGMTIVGPNNTGKTNILRAIQLLFTGLDNKYNYQRDLDLTFRDTRSRTSLVAVFEGDPLENDKDIYDSLDELHSILGTSRNDETEISLNLQFSSNSNPTYQFFPNAKKPRGNKQAQFSAKHRQLVTDLLSKFACFYIPSEKGVKELYNDLLVPSLKSLVAEKIYTYIDDIRGILDATAENINSVFSDVGISGIKASFGVPNDSLEEFISGFDFRLRDPEETSIFRKGMGIQSTAMMASFLWITSEEISRGRSVIWLLEEPESYLHPGLSLNCDKILKKLKEYALVVSTTHSLSFIPQDPKIVIGTELDSSGRTKFNSFKTYFEAGKSLRGSLGVRFSDYYNFSKFNVLLEGPTDRDYFLWILDLIPNNHDGFSSSWPYLRSAENSFMDFGGIKFLTGFLRATYEFISKETIVVSVFDGDSAAEDERRKLQHYFSNKQIPFNPNLHYVSVRNRFAIEGLFPDEWIINAYEEHSSWFDDFSVDASNYVEPFRVKDTSKTQFSNFMKALAKEKNDYKWAERWINVCQVIDSALEKLTQQMESQR